MRFKLTYNGKDTLHSTLGGALAKCKKDKLNSWSIWDNIEERVILHNKIENS